MAAKTKIVNTQKLKEIYKDITGKEYEICICTYTDNETVTILAKSSTSPKMYSVLNLILADDIKIIPLSIHYAETMVAAYQQFEYQVSDFITDSLNKLTNVEKENEN